jgi:uncharacterized RDD family membrane protein YckC
MPIPSATISLVDRLPVLRTPGLFRLLASFFYDALLAVALLFVATFIFVLLFGEATHAPKRYLLQICLWTVVGFYFAWCWARGGTLAMQAWKIRLVDSEGHLISSLKAMQRYVLATIGLLAAGLGFWWALVDKDHRYLHDRLLDTRLVMSR